jgi:hypothetical protein
MGRTRVSYLHCLMAQLYGLDDAPIGPIALVSRPDRQ